MKPSVALRNMRVAVAGVGLLLMAATARADDAYYRIPIDQLKITEGELPKQPQEAPLDGSRYSSRWVAIQYLSPYAVLDGEGEVHVNLAPNAEFRHPLQQRIETLTVRAPAGKDVTGNLYVPVDDRSKLRKVRFRIPAAPSGTDFREPREAFLRMREQHYQYYLNRGLPGAPWFRYQVRQSQAALTGTNGAEFTVDRGQLPRDGSFNNSRFDDTYNLFSGGRAISENLQLDRLLPTTNPDDPTVDVAGLAGITVAEMDWTELTKDVHPELDPLAKILPSDQHALLFPDFNSMLRLMDEAAENGTPVLQAIEPRSESARTRERYEKQLCLPVTALARLLGDQVVAGVAFTGSDPYLRTGTDLAILFEAKNALALRTHISTQQAAAIQGNPECKKVEGKIGDASYTGALSPDRSVCSYMAQVGNAVVVTNSLAQLKRIVETSAGQSESLASLPEYAFFRNRYQRGKDETGLLIVTDKTIRRWCGAKWRIAASRRTRAAAIMAHYQSVHMNDLVTGAVEPHDIRTILDVPDLGTLRLTKEGVTSSTYGSLDFLTPIAELDFTKVTKTEADTYERWRLGYQQNWSQFFDPIAVSFTVRDDRLAADLTVMPLIDASEYRWFIDLASGVQLKPDAGDPHAGTLLHWAVALNPKSERLSWADNFVERTTKVSMLGWLGGSVSIYADDDPFWDDLVNAVSKGESMQEAGNAGEEFFEQNLHRLPVAFNAEVSSGLKLTLFLTGLRAFVEQTAPGMLNWTSLEHNGQSYVKITPTASGKRDVPFADKLAIHYAATPNMLIVTLNEDLLKRALDRIAEKAKSEGKENAGAAGVPTSDKPADASNAEVVASAKPRPWLGKSLAVQIDRKVLQLMESEFGRNEYQALMQSHAWSNLAILNEWKQLYPDRDPVEVHQEIWQTKLECPGGGKYVWNAEYRTMESTVYGHPGEPKMGPLFPKPLQTIRTADFGLTFENRGLRAQAELSRDADK